MTPATEPTDDSITGTPRWVKVFGAIALIVVLLFVTALFTRGPHRPGRHMPSVDTGGETSPMQRR